MRLRIIAVVVAVVVGVSIVVALEHFPALSGRVQHNVRQYWVLGTLIAVVASCSVAQTLWQYRQYLRVWVLLATFLLLHFAFAVPSIGKLGLIRTGDITELYLFLFAIAEAATLNVLLARATTSLSRTEDS